MTTPTPIGYHPTIRFNDKTIPSYVPPRDTTDERYANCSEHHVGCDCREAWFAETLREYKAERERAMWAFNAVLKGHPTWAYTDTRGRDESRECKCTGCEIARHTHLRGPVEVSEERRESR